MDWLRNLGTIFNGPYGNFQWTVDTYINTYIKCPDTYIESPCFSFQNFEWRLILTINTYIKTGKLMVEKAKCFFERKHLNNSKEEFDVDISMQWFDEAHTNTKLCNYKWKHKLRLREGEPKLLPLSEFLDAHYCLYRLQLSCTIRKLDSDENNGNSENGETAETNSKSVDKSNTKQVAADEKMPVLGPKGMDRLVQNLQNMFLEGQHTDVILKVGNTEFPAHKNILSTRCNTFANMFQHDMTEKISNVVDIPDCSPEAFKVFLLYLYTGNVSTISADTVCNVYYAADKYQVDDLKEDCIEFMKKTLSAETVCDVVALSLLHSESELLKLATEFFRDNLKKILKTVQWQKYMKDHPTHANELLIKSLDA